MLARALSLLRAASGFAPHASWPGEYGFFHAGSAVFRNFGDSIGRNNSFVRNVVVATSNQSVWDILSPVRHARPRPFATVAHNLYYSPLQRLQTMATDRTGSPPFQWVNAQEVGWTDGSWRNWTQGMLHWDAGSHVDVDPGFRDPSRGDFTLRADAAARRLIGFEEIDPRVLPC